MKAYAKNIIEKVLRGTLEAVPISAKRKSIILYELHMRRKLRYLRRDVAPEMRRTLVAQYKKVSCKTSDEMFEKQFQELQVRYKKVCIVKNNLLNVGPMCDLYLSLCLLLEHGAPDAKVVLLLYDGAAPVYDAAHPKIANDWLLHKIKQLVEVIDVETAPLWGYIVAKHRVFCCFDSADPFGRVRYPDREKMLHQKVNRYPSKGYLSFSEEERQRGEQALRDIGLIEKKYFCFFSRNNEYHEMYFKNQGTEMAEQTAVRNSSIEDFVAAIRRLHLPELRAVRVGAVDSRRVEGENIFDYTNTCRDAFLDFFLMGHAKFFLGDASGIGCIPWLMNIPQAITNNFSIFWCSAEYYNYNSTMNFTIYKKWWDRGKARYLTLEEILSISWKYGVTDEDELRLYNQLGIEFHPNTPEEIADFLYEMNLRVDGKWQEEEEVAFLREKFWTLVNEAMRKAPPEIVLWDYEPGGLFLKRNKWWLS